MDFITKLSLMSGLLLSLIGIGTLIYKSGKHNANVMGEIGNLKKDIENLSAHKNENKTKIEKLTEIVNLHMMDNLKHVNIELETQIRNENKEQMARIERKLEGLLCK